MQTWFSLKYQLVKSRLFPGRLKNFRVEGWGKMLKEMRQFWEEGKETILETSYWQNADGSEKRLI
jgi:hypothetical protein